MNTGRLLKSKRQFSRDELAGLLESIAGRIREGSLTLGEGSEAIAMDLPTTFSVEIEVEDSGRRQLKRELELEIEWPVEADGTPIDASGSTSGFTVS
ncbi:amphi-Trp domain-containing protein [Mycobacterium asiaticum]|uniref:amphi-Trp domain-containing protein n=1 Tax=Mycobacterium asiaticum TaxID=1790 RepID=UPI000ADDF69B|nr:amphi-Trp domain-containing protein [Mycobacterium asiaticum]